MLEMKLSQIANLRSFLVGKGIMLRLENTKTKVKETVFTPGNNKDFALRDQRWAYIRYPKGERELYDMEKDPKQYTNLFSNPEYTDVVGRLRQKLKARLAEIADNDLTEE